MAAIKTRVCKIIQKQFADAIKQPNEYIKFWIDPNNVTNVYIMIYGAVGNQDEFVGGEYLAEVKLPIGDSISESYPFKPPLFRMLTPNGIFTEDALPCTTNSVHHPKDFLQNGVTRGLDGFCMEWVNGLISYKDLGAGIAIIRNPKLADLKYYAADSRKYNAAKYPELVKNINDNFERYSSTWVKAESSPPPPSPPPSAMSNADMGRPASNNNNNAPNILKVEPTKPFISDR
jgi:hypothetical protein